LEQVEIVLLRSKYPPFVTIIFGVGKGTQVLFIPFEQLHIEFHEQSNNVEQVVGCVWQVLFWAQIRFAWHQVESWQYWFIAAAFAL